MFSKHPAGALVEVWVVPGASQNELVGEHDGALKIRVAAPAEGGKANLAVTKLLATAVPGHRITVVTGHSSRRKQVLIEGISMAAVREALDRFRMAKRQPE